MFSQASCLIVSLKGFSKVRSQQTCSVKSAPNCAVATCPSEVALHHSQCPSNNQITLLEEGSPWFSSNI